MLSTGLFKDTRKKLFSDEIFKNADANFNEIVHTSILLGSSELKGYYVGLGEKTSNSFVFQNNCTRK